MNSICITGASSGIGRALCIHFSKLQYTVFAVARSADKLEQTRELGNSSCIHTICADVSVPDDRTKIAQEIGKVSTSLKYLVHNAGTINPIKRARDVTLQEWKDAFAVNVEGPMFLTQSLLPFLSSGSRILHVSSGAAHGPNIGWSTYCTSKAALFMVNQCWARELAEEGICVGSFKPGVVNTAMQDLIRKSSKDDFPALDKFKKLKENESKEECGRGHTPPQGGLDQPENVAHFVQFLLEKTNPEEFSSHDWDVRDPSHAQRWVKQ